MKRFRIEKNGRHLGTYDAKNQRAAMQQLICDVWANTADDADEGESLRSSGYITVEAAKLRPEFLMACFEMLIANFDLVVVEVDLRDTKHPTPCPDCGAAKLRVVWDFEEEPDLSHLKLWDTPEKYYDIETPICPICGKPMWYIVGHTFGCIDGCDGCGGYRERPEQCSFAVYKDITPGPNNGVVVDSCGTAIGFSEYELFHGDPSHHVILSCSIERLDHVCGEWIVVAENNNLDYMDTDGFRIGEFEEAELEHYLNPRQLKDSKSFLEDAKTQLKVKLSTQQPNTPTIIEQHNATEGLAQKNKRHVVSPYRLFWTDCDRGVDVDCSWTFDSVVGAREGVRAFLEELLAMAQDEATCAVVLRGAVRCECGGSIEFVEGNLGSILDGRD